MTCASPHVTRFENTFFQIVINLRNFDPSQFFYGRPAVHYRKIQSNSIKWNFPSACPLPPTYKVICSKVEAFPYCTVIICIGLSVFSLMTYISSAQFNVVVY